MATQVDVVYPLKRDAGDYDEFRHSLRSLRNLEHHNVFTVGGKPTWFTGGHIKAQQQPEKYTDVSSNIRAACLSEAVSDPFIAFNDDFFVLRPTGVQPYWRESLDDSIARVTARGMHLWWKHFYRIREHIGDGMSYELHLPIVVHKQPMLEALSLAGLGPAWRTAYGILAGIGGTQRSDVKVKSDEDQFPWDDFVSCSDGKYMHGVGQKIREMFPDPSPYES